MGEQRKLCRRMSTRKSSAEGDREGTKASHVGEREPPCYAASKRALSKGRWGTGAGTGKNKAARVTSTLPIGSGAGRAATGHSKRESTSRADGRSQGPWHTKMQ